MQLRDLLEGHQALRQFGDSALVGHTLVGLHSGPCSWVDGSIIASATT